MIEISKRSEGRHGSSFAVIRERGPNGRISWEGEFMGPCPMQSHGTVDDLPYSFRARHDSWEFAVATAGGDPCFVGYGAHGFALRKPYGEPGGHDAGWISLDEAAGMMASAVAEYRQWAKSRPVRERIRDWWLRIRNGHHVELESNAQ